MNKAKLTLYSASCLKCTRLVGDMGKREMKACWAERSDHHCPAVTVELVIGPDMMNTAQRIFAEYVQGHETEYTDMLNALDTETPEVKDAIKRRVTTLIQEYNDEQEE